jgi:hypothetical protein
MNSLGSERKRNLALLRGIRDSAESKVADRLRAIAKLEKLLFGVDPSSDENQSTEAGVPCDLRLLDQSDFLAFKNLVQAARVGCPMHTSEK